jgi:nucleotide-binding universal stress UspA family protein
MAPYAAEMAKWLSATLYIVQVLELGAAARTGAPAGDLYESNYIRAKAKEYKETYGIKTNWEVLHGEPTEAIARQVSGKPHVLLAMATHGHNPLKAAVMGSVTAGCLQKTGVPLLTRIP